MNVILIRHTRVVPPPGTCYGWCDVPLADTWRDDIAAVRAALPWTPRELWTSPAARCRTLAEGLGFAREEIVIEPRLRELHMGEWEGRPWDAFRGPESEAWALDPWRLSPPGGESAEAFWARVAALRETVLASEPERLVLVTHAGVIRAWRGIAEGVSFEAALREPIPFGSLWPAK
jgi:alpha-ribazole phosphatase